MGKMNRRKFLVNSCKACSAMAAGAAFSRLGMIDAYAQNVDPASFQALVCIFLYGGNDANNMVIPIDTAGYNAYAGLNGAGPGRGPNLTIAQNLLVPMQLTFNGAVTG